MNIKPIPYEKQNVVRMRGKTTFIIVHDAFQCAFSWYPVFSILSRLGNKTYVMDLPAHGERTEKAKDMSIGKYAEEIVRLIDKEKREYPDKHFTLVGHGTGALAILVAAESRKACIDKLVMLASPIPKNGESLAQLLDENIDALSKDNFTIDPDTFMEAHPIRYLCGERQWNSMKKFFRSEPLALWNDAIQYENQIPSFYIDCKRDEWFTDELRDSILNRFDWKAIYDVDADHNAEQSVPVEIAFILHEIGRL